MAIITHSVKHRLLLLAWGLVCVARGDSGDARLKYFRSEYGVAVVPGALPEKLDEPRALRWRVPLDSGHSTPILADGKIVLTTFRPESQELATVAMDSQTGQLLWRRPISPSRIELTHQLGSPATPTPAWDGQRLFVFFGSYGLLCYDLEGTKLWEHRMGPFQDEYGAGSSPVLVDGKVVLNQDHDVESFLAAFDCATGRTVWKAARPGAVRSYSTPAVWLRDGRPELLVAGALELAGYDPASGGRIWALQGLARIVVPTPVPAGEMVYMASWAPGGDAGNRLALDSWPSALSKWDQNQDGHLAKAEVGSPEVLDRFYRMDLDQNGTLNEREWTRHAEVFRQAQNAVLALKPTGRGELSEAIVMWKHVRGVPYVATPLLDNGILWLVKDGGIVTKLDAASGRLLQEERVPGYGSYFASPVAGDGKVYFASEQGTVSIVANKTEWELISSHAFKEKIYATPVPDRDRMIIRTEKALYLFEGQR